MNNIVAFSNLAVSMTSREIAELTGKRHDNVKRTIDDLCSKKVISTPQIEVIEDINNLGAVVRREAYVFDHAHKRDSIVVVAQLSPEFTGRLVDRWQELESQVTGQPTADLIPQERAARLLKAELSVADLLQIPLHFAQLEAVKTVHRETGLDYRPLLALAPAQSTVAPEDVMLEPADLAKRLNIKDGATVNKWLKDCGLQVKEGKAWVPTEEGKAISAAHQWSTTFKSGYNLKWSLAAVRAKLPSNWPALTT